MKGFNRGELLENDAKVEVGDQSVRALGFSTIFSGQVDLPALEDLPVFQKASKIKEIFAGQDLLEPPKASTQERPFEDNTVWIYPKPR